MTTLRSIQAADLAPLGELLDAVFRRPHGITDQHILTDFPLVFQPENFRNCRILEIDGRIVSHAGIWPRELVVGTDRLKIGAIVVVATDEAFRQRGYAASLMRDLQRTLVDEDYDLAILWTSVPDFYRKLGWEVFVPRGQVATLDDETDLPAGDVQYRIETYDPNRHLDAIIALHEQEPVRFHRSRSDYVAMLAFPKVQTWVASHREQVAGYVVDAAAVNKRGINEYGGELPAIAAMLAQINASKPSRTRQLLLHNARPDLIDWARSSELPLEPMQACKGPGCEMIYVIHPERVTAEVRRRLFVWGLDLA